MSTDDSIPFGYCHCGCGRKTNLVKNSDKTRGLIAGHPNRYIKGHFTRQSGEDFLENEEGCWVWQLSLNQTGYPMVRSGGKTQAAHRVYYETYIGPIPDGLHLDHLCRTRACVNPGHLEAIRPIENAQRSAKLDAEAAKAIYLAKGSTRALDLADRFGVGVLSIYRIWGGKTWANVTEGLS